jgi:protein-disulfide isomerase
VSTVNIGQRQEDPTRKQRRAQARAQRRALEQAQAASAVKRTRLMLLGIVLAVVVVGIGVVVLTTAGSRGVRNIAPESGEARNLNGQVTALLAGIPQDGNALGQPTAPVTLQYFGDLECPVCRAFTLGALPPIIQRWVRTGKLRLEYRSLETATREPEVFKAQQVAALAAGEQNKMWNFVETFYHEQQEEDTGYVTENFIQGIAKQVPGLNLAEWAGDRDDVALANQVASDGQAASSSSLDGTPAFLIGRSGGPVSQLEPSSFTEPGSFNQAIEKLVKS